MMAASKAKQKGSGKAAAKYGAANKGGFGAAKGATKVTASIPTLTLNTGSTIPALGFGTYKAEGDKLAKALETAIAVGYRHIDTAQIYQNEEIVGEAIASSGIARESFFLTTKLWGTSHGDGRTQPAIETSLKSLGTPYIDLLLLHSPSNHGRSAEEVVALRQQSWLAMEEAYHAGICKAIGVSNFEARHIESVLEVGSVTPAVNQIESHARFAQKDLVQYCESRGILVTAYGSVGAKGLRADTTVQAIAAKHKRTPAQISLRHTLSRQGGSMAVLTKSVTTKRVAENALAFEFELDADDMTAMDALDTGTRSYWDNSEVT